jgi:hypothetical protein
MRSGAPRERKREREGEIVREIHRTILSSQRSISCYLLRATHIPLVLLLLVSGNQ